MLRGILMNVSLPQDSDGRRRMLFDVAMHEGQAFVPNEAWTLQRTPTAPESRLQDAPSELTIRDANNWGFLSLELYPRVTDRIYVSITNGPHGMQVQLTADDARSLSAWLAQTADRMDEQSGKKGA